MTTTPIPGTEAFLTERKEGARTHAIVSIDCALHIEIEQGTRVARKTYKRWADSLTALGDNQAFLAALAVRLKAHLGIDRRHTVRAEITALEVIDDETAGGSPPGTADSEEEFIFFADPDIQADAAASYMHERSMIVPAEAEMSIERRSPLLDVSADDFGDALLTEGTVPQAVKQYLRPVAELAGQALPKAPLIAFVLCHLSQAEESRDDLIYLDHRVISPDSDWWRPISEEWKDKEGDTRLYTIPLPLLAAAADMRWTKAHGYVSREDDPEWAEYLRLREKFEAGQ